MPDEERHVALKVIEHRFNLLSAQENAAEPENPAENTDSGNQDASNQVLSLD